MSEMTAEQALDAVHDLIRDPDGIADNMDLMYKLKQVEGFLSRAVQSKVAPHCDYGYITPAKGNPWFSYDPQSDGMVFFETEKEARADAQRCVDLSLDEFWSEDVDRICYGRVTHAATQVDRIDRPESLDEDGHDEDGEYWPSDCEFKCNYELLPLAATKEATND
jgi:hypothetical protein